MLSLQPGRSNKRQRQKRDIDFWDEPLPEPKVKNKPKPEAPVEAEQKEVDGVLASDWVGVAGVDFFEDSRARSAHVTMPSAIGTQSFIFPVCHDQGLYGKILEVQSARRSTEPILANASIRDVIRNEGALQGVGGLRKRREKSKTGAAKNEEEEDEPEATDSEDEDTGATWPGLEELLPVHSTKDFLNFM